MRPGQAGWPSEAEWSELGKATNGTLSQVSLPDLSTPEQKRLLLNQIWLGDQAGLTQISGWIDGWSSAPSANAAKIRAAMQALRLAAPDAGSYLSESDFNKPNWQKESWGEHWQRLSEIKRRYDPRGLFVVHNGVGSEAWSADGFTRA